MRNQTLATATRQGQTDYEFLTAMQASTRGRQPTREEVEGLEALLRRQPADIQRMAAPLMAQVKKEAGLA